MRRSLSPASQRAAERRHSREAERRHSHDRPPSPTRRQAAPHFGGHRGGPPAAGAGPPSGPPPPPWAQAEARWGAAAGGGAARTGPPGLAPPGLGGARRPPGMHSSSSAKRPRVEEPRGGADRRSVEEPRGGAGRGPRVDGQRGGAERTLSPRLQQRGFERRLGAKPAAPSPSASPRPAAALQLPPGWREGDALPGAAKPGAAKPGSASADSAAPSRYRRVGNLSVSVDERLVESLLEQRQRAKANRDSTTVTSTQSRLRQLRVRYNDGGLTWTTDFEHDREYTRVGGGTLRVPEAEVADMLAQRHDAKLTRDFGRADRLEARLRSFGIVINDREKTWSCPAQVASERETPAQSRAGTDHGHGYRRAVRPRGLLSR